MRAFTALSALDSLDLTGVRLPLASVAALHALTGLTALRIPHATLVAERFLELQSELPNVPPLEALLAALPRLRHLDLFWTGPGENQNIMKDGKYLKSLALSTSLRCAVPRPAPAARVLSASARASRERVSAGAWTSPSCSR